MFSKAQRFNSKGVGCGADVAYTPKDLDKPIGGVITKGDRFESNGSVKSDTESVHSEQLFRTPKAVRPLGLASSAKRQPGKMLNSVFKSYSTDNFARDVLESKNVEIRNKDETICEYEQQIKEMNNIISKLNEEIINHKYDDEKFSENQIKAEEQINKLQSEIQDLRENIHNSDKNVKELCNNSLLLQKTIECKETQLRELHSKLQLLDENSLEHSNEVKILKSQKEKACKEKDQFCLTLSTTRNTVEALGSRLRASDEDVEKLKLELEKLNSAKQSSESELEQVKEDLKNYKLEYNQLLLTIINSKIALDESNKAILDKNSQLKEDLVFMETEFVKDIEMIKMELENDISMFKQLALKQVGDLEKKALSEHNLYLTMKSECDQAYKTITDCQNILFRAECQLETKEQELNEMATENDRLSGTLAAVDQEKNELQVLINEFRNLIQEKDRKLHDYDSKLFSSQDETYHFEERLKKMSHFLEATEFIVKEKDYEIIKLHGEIDKYSANNAASEREKIEISAKCIQLESACNSLKRELNTYHETSDSKGKLITDLRNEICTLEKKINDSENHRLTCKEDLLQQHCSNLERDLTDMTSKYTNLLGHQNNKQKIKHVNDLKTQNFTLKEENEKLSFTIQRQASMIEKLKKEMTDVMCKSPLPSRKQILMSTPLGKENITSPMGKSPKLMGSPKLAERPLTPLRDLNR